MNTPVQVDSPPLGMNAELAGPFKILGDVAGQFMKLLVELAKGRDPTVLLCILGAGVLVVALLILLLIAIATKEPVVLGVVVVVLAFFWILWLAVKRISEYAAGQDLAGRMDRVRDAAREKEDDHD